MELLFVYHGFLTSLIVSQDEIALPLKDHLCLLGVLLDLVYD